MPTYHRSQRLRLVGTGPKVEQLQESRYRLTFTCTSTNPSEAWLNSNKSQLFADYGTLQSAQMNIAGVSARTGEAYADMALIRVEANPSEKDMVVTLVYETVDQDNFQKFQDDLVEVQDNGLRRVTQYEIGKHNLSKTLTVGSTSITSGGVTCILSSKKEEVNDTFKLITTVYVESGILSTSEDNVGSQKAVVISKFESTAPAVDTTIAGIDLTGYSLAKQDEGSVEGAITYNYTFLKNNVQLSRSVDNESPLKTEVREYFKPDSSKENLANYSLVNKQESNIDGIPTERYTFAKDNVEVSKSEDNVGSQLAIVRTFFNPSSDPTESGYSLAKKDQRNFDGIKTIQYTFLKENVQLSRSVNNESPLKTETREYFKPDSSKETLANYSLVNKQESNVDGIPTERYTFAKNNVTLSVSEEKIGSQNAVVNEIFNPTSESITGVDTDNSALSGYSEADRRESNYDGIKTIRVRFLKNDVVLSRSRDSIGSQKAVVLEVFNGNNEASDANSYGAGSSYVLAREEESNVDGVKTRRYTYLEPSILSVQREKNNAAAPITVRTFNLASDHSSVSASSGSPQVSTTTHILVSSTEENFEGVKTNVFRFESKDYNTREKNEFGRIIIDRVEQSESSFSLDDQTAQYNVEGVYGLRILNQTTENNDNVVNRRLTKYTTVGIDEVREDIVGSQKAIIITKVGAEPTTTEASTYSDITYDGSSDWSIARKNNSRVAGLDVYTYTFLLDNTVLSVSEDKIGSQEAYIEEVFNPLVTIPGITISGGSSVAGDYFLSSSTYNSKNRYFTADGGTYAKLLQYTGSVWEVRQFTAQYATNSGTNPNNANDPPETGWSGTGNNLIENLLFRDFDNTLPTSLQGLSTSHRYEKDGYVLAKMDRSNIDGISTVRYTFLRPSVLSVQEDFIEDANRVTVEAFNKTSTEVASDILTSDHRLISQRETNRDGIATFTYVFEVQSSDKIEFTQNNRLKVTRTIYQSQAYDYASNYEVGDTATINSTSVVLSQISVDQRNESGTFTKIVLIYIEPGEDSRAIQTGPTNLPGTEKIVVQSTGITAVTLTETTDIKLISSSDQNNNGFKTFTRSYIKGTEATSTTTTFVSGRTYKINTTNNYSSVGGPSTGVVGNYFEATSSATVSGATAYLVGQIIGTKNTYKEIVEVYVPGTVECKTLSLEGQIDTQTTSATASYIASVPPYQTKIKATVTQSIQTTVPEPTATLAYSLDDIACSIAYVSSGVNKKTGAAATAVSNSGTSVSTQTGFARNVSASARSSYYPGYYIVDNESSAIVATSTVAGRKYRIVSAGNTDFTAIGAANSTVGTVFTATGAGTGTGTVRWFGARGRIQYTSSSVPRVNGNTIVQDTGDADTLTYLYPTGSTSQSDGSAPTSYSTSGTLKQKSRPVLTCLDGTVFYETIVFSA